MSARKHKTTAEVIDGVLVVASMNGETPRIWRGDLSRLGVAAFELQKKKDSYVLAVKDVAEDQLEEIASYADQSAAADALGAVHKAVMSGSTGVSHKKIWTVLVMFFVVLCLFAYLKSGSSMRSLPKLSSKMNLPTAQQLQKQQATPKVKTEDVRTGVPVDADSLFGE